MTGGGLPVMQAAEGGIEAMLSAFAGVEGTSLITSH